MARNKEMDTLSDELMDRFNGRARGVIKVLLCGIDDLRMISVGTCRVAPNGGNCWSRPGTIGSGREWGKRLIVPSIDDFA